MSTDPSISIVFEDGSGNIYGLIADVLGVGLIRLREEKIVPVYLKNMTIDTCTDITVEAIAHPTNQVGSAAETYDAVQFGLTIAGPWFDILDIASMIGGELKLIYMNWTMPEEAIPGLGQFAIEVKGDMSL